MNWYGKHMQSCLFVFFFNVLFVEVTVVLLEIFINFKAMAVQAGGLAPISISKILL